MNFHSLKTRISAFAIWIRDYCLDRQDENAEEIEHWNFHNVSVVIPPPLPVAPEHSPAHEMILLLQGCREELEGAAGLPIPIDGFDMKEVRKLIFDACPHPIAARFSFLAGWDNVDDPIERWINLNQVATMLMSIEVYFWPDNPRVRVLRRACEARARLAERDLEWEKAA